MFFYYLKQIGQENECGMLYSHKFEREIMNLAADSVQNFKSSCETMNPPIQIAFSQGSDQNKTISCEKTMKIVEKMRNRKQKRHQEQQYVPENESEIVKGQKKSSQNCQRNILPNIMHQIFCFIQKKVRSFKIVQLYFLKNTAKICSKASIKRFYNYQKLLKDKTNHYVSFKAVKELNNFQEPSYQVYSQEEQEEYIRLNRVLVKYFINNQLLSVIMTSVRMNGESRKHYLSIRRKVIEALEQSLFQTQDFARDYNCEQ